jgi:hypothetical protein
MKPEANQSLQREKYAEQRQERKVMGQPKELRCDERFAAQPAVHLPSYGTKKRGRLLDATRFALNQL